MTVVAFDESRCCHTYFAALELGALCLFQGTPIPRAPQLCAVCSFAHIALSQRRTTSPSARTDQSKFRNQV